MTVFCDNDGCMFSDGCGFCDCDKLSIVGGVCAGSYRSGRNACDGDVDERLKAENAKLRELACHLWYVKPRDVTSVLVEGKLVDLEELMESVGLRWEDA